MPIRFCTQIRCLLSNREHPWAVSLTIEEYELSGQSFLNDTRFKKKRKKVYFGKLRTTLSCISIDFFEVYCISEYYIFGLLSIYTFQSRTNDDNS